MTADQLYPRSLRLLQSKDFHRVFNQTDCKSADRCLVLLAHRNNLEHPRLGMAIAKKKIKSAVQRNRIKRLVRESFRNHRVSLLGIDIVVMSRSVAAETSNLVLLNNLQNHWKTLANRCKE
jgi:ribonuclease P protein component